VSRLVCSGRNRIRFLNAANVFRFMPETFSIIGYGRSDHTDESLRKKAQQHLDQGKEEQEKFLKTVRRFHCNLAPVDAHAPAPGLRCGCIQLRRMLCT
jgi:glucose-6-phosphate 1-dehydrogenase